MTSSSKQPTKAAQQSSDLYQQKAIRQFSDPTFYTKVNKNLTSANQKIVKDTIQELITNQEPPVNAQNLIITTPKTSCIYFKPKFINPTTHAVQSFQHAAAEPNLSRAI